MATSSTQHPEQPFALGFCIAFVLLFAGAFSTCGCATAGAQLRGAAAKIEADAMRYALACEASADEVLAMCRDSGGDQEQCEDETLAFLDECLWPIVRFIDETEAKAEALCAQWGLDCGRRLLP